MRRKIIIKNLGDTNSWKSNEIHYAQLITEIFGLFWMDEFIKLLQERMSDIESSALIQRSSPENLWTTLNQKLLVHWKNGAEKHRIHESALLSTHNPWDHQAYLNCAQTENYLPIMSFEKSCHRHSYQN